MKKICILSDTHGYIDEKIMKHVNQCDEVWHCGDIGSDDVFRQLKTTNKLRAVFGNIDGQDIRIQVPQFLRFEVEGVKILMTHIGGYPGKYDKLAKTELLKQPTNLFVCGHSHILKAMFDKDLQIMHLNPGAVGIYGFHKVRTLMELTIDNGQLTKLEVVEFEDRHPKISKD